MLPILNYGCEVWGFHMANNIERVYTQYCKNMLSVKRSTHNNCVYGELGRFPLFVGRCFRIIKYWFKIIESQDHKYVNIVYNILRNDIEVFPHKKRIGKFIT